MQYIKNKKVISIAMVFISIGYYAEGSPGRNDARSRAVPSPPTSTTARTTTTPTQSSSHCIKHSPVDLKDPHHAIELHPVSRLHEIQAKLHQSEPIFKVIGHRGEQNKNNREYHMQVMVNDKSASAWGHTKRDAKRRAAIVMLNLMGLPVEGDGTNVIC